MHTSSQFVKTDSIGSTDSTQHRSEMLTSGSRSSVPAKRRRPSFFCEGRETSEWRSPTWSEKHRGDNPLDSHKAFSSLSLQGNSPVPFHPVRFSWVPSLRSAASAWRKRSTASCFVKLVTSVVTRSRFLPDWPLPILGEMTQRRPLWMALLLCVEGVDSGNRRLFTCRKSPCTPPGKSSS